MQAHKKTLNENSASESKDPAMSMVDRLRAIKRHPKFKADWEEYQSICRAKDEIGMGRAMIAINQKWGYDPDRIRGADDSKKPRSWVEVVTRAEIENQIKQRLPDRSAVIFSTGNRQEERTHFETGEGFLWVKIHLNGSRKELLRDFGALIDRYRKRVGLETREGSGALDPWEIYDLREEGKNLNQITRSKFKFGKHVHPSYHDDMHKRHEMVSYAFDKARAMINSVTPRGVDPPFPEIS